MALTYAVVAQSEDTWGRTRTILVDITLDTSYPTGGYSLSKPAIGMSSVMGARTEGIKGTLANSGGLIPQYDVANNKLMLFLPTGGATAPATLVAPVAAAAGAGTLAATATPASGATAVTSTSAQPAIPVVFTGALAAPALTAGIGLEVGSTCDVSTVTLRMRFFGA